MWEERELGKLGKATSKCRREDGREFQRREYVKTERLYQNNARHALGRERGIKD